MTAPADSILKALADRLPTELAAARTKMKELRAAVKEQVELVAKLERAAKILSTEGYDD